MPLSAGLCSIVSQGFLSIRASVVRFSLVLSTRQIIDFLRLELAHSTTVASQYIPIVDVCVITSFLRWEYSRNGYCFPREFSESSPK